MIQPISKYLTAATIVVSIVISLCDLKHLFILTYSPFLSKWNQYYRLLILQFNFNNESEILLSMVIFLKVFNDIERLLGFYKFLSILLMAFWYNIAVIFIELFLSFNTTGLNIRISSGPIGIVFAVLSFYNDLIPITYKFVFNFGSHKFVFNDKVFILVLGCLLLINQGFNSLIPSFNGWIIGKLILNDVLPAKNFKWSFVKRLLHRRKTHTVQPALTRVEDEDDENRFTTNEDGANPVRPLGIQLLDTFRT